MPIYEYRCSSCGHQQEFMQKVSDPLLSVCTRCNKPTFSKMVTAAGFQLKGSGWYATDFKSKAAAPDSKPQQAGDSRPEGGSAGEPAKKGDSGEGSGSKAAACGAGACPACQ